MRRRFFQLLLLVAVLAAAFAGVARALDFDDEDPHPPHGEIGAFYSYEIGTHAGCLPHRLEVASGELPPGLTLRRVDLDTHVLEGVPTEAGVFSAWIHLLDCDNRSAQTLFTFEIWTRRWGIATDALRPAAVGSPYSFTLQVSGVPSVTTWEVTSGSLPAGLALSKEGTISGTPTATGTATFTVKATGAELNFGPTRFDSRQYTLNVLQPLSASVSRATAEAKVPFRAALVAAGGQGPYTWTASGLPAGLAVGADGVITGVPSRAGSYTVGAHLTDANGLTNDIQVRLVVRPRLAIATRRLPAATHGRPFRAQLTARGGVEGRRWGVVLPRGLKLNAATGRISGAPSRAGTYRLKVRVRDALGAVSAKSLVLRVR
jgi:large repetitive protein